jgi:hypothetical protein
MARPEEMEHMEAAAPNPSHPAAQVYDVCEHIMKSVISRGYDIRRY